MNKDLEIIKQNEPYRRIDFEDYKVGFDSIKWRAVIEAAERMAAEIERLEEEKILLIKFIDEIASHGQRRESKEGK